MSLGGRSRAFLPLSCPLLQQTMTRSRSSSPNIALSSLGVSEISESDYFQKSTEFRTWLRDEKGKYFDELTGERARQ